MESNRLTTFQRVCQLAWSQINWLHFSLCASSNGVKSIDCISACVPARMESNQLTTFQRVCHPTCRCSQIDWLHSSLCVIGYHPTCSHIDSLHVVKSIDYIPAITVARHFDWLHFNMYISSSSLCSTPHVVKSIDYIPACVYIPKVATQNEMSQKCTSHCCVFVTQRNSSAKCQNAMSQKRTMCCIFVITKTHNVTKMHNIDILKK